VKRPIVQAVAPAPIPSTPVMIAAFIKGGSPNFGLSDTT